MKKTLSLLLALVMCLSLCACDGGNDTTEASEQLENSKQVKEDDASEETKNEESSEEVQEEESSESSEQTEESETSDELINSLDSNWQYCYFVDEFGDETGDPVFGTVVSGTFSNTAVSDAELKVVIYFDQAHTMEELDTFYFQLYEYGDHKATIMENDELILKIKRNGTIYEQELKSTSQNGALWFEGHTISNGSFTDFYKQLNPALWSGENVPCIIYIGNSKYSFTFDCEGWLAFYNANKNY